MTPFHVDPDIRKAETLPAEFYTRDDVFAASKDRVLQEAGNGSATRPHSFPRTVP